MDCILAYDLGTGGVKASLFSADATCIASTVVEYPTYHRPGGLREQEPADWWKSIVKATGALTAQLAEKNISAEIAAIGLSGHSLGAVAVDRDGNLLDRYTPIWSDERAEQVAKPFLDTAGERDWYYATGNGFPPHLYTAFKIMWYKKYNPELYDRVYKFLGTKDYINYRLTGVMATDRSYASGSGVYDLTARKYREDYLEIMGISSEKLCEITASHTVIGNLTGSSARELGLPSGIPVVSGGVDNACMTLGAGCYEDGDAYASLGTSAWVAASSKTPILNWETRPYVWAHCVDGMFVPNIGIFASGSALDWVKTTLLEGVCADYNEFFALAEASAVGANHLFFNPCLAGGNYMDGSAHIRGCFTGLDLCHTRSDIARATVEGIAYHLRKAWDVLKPNLDTKELLLVGGGAKNTLARQIYADIFGIPVVKTDIMRDAASLGAAATAAYGVGLWKDYSPIKAAHGNRCVTEPDSKRVAQYERLFEIYRYISSCQAHIGDLIRETE
ncbi:MAG: pentose kinase [Clostridia bacterium]|nr:pentose kinase [Clostridia bacterium]